MGRVTPPHRGFSSQWKTLDEETGEAEWVRPLALVHPAMREQYAEAHEQGFHPGIIDEYAALLNLPVSAFGGHSEALDEASVRYDRMREDILSDLGLDESKGALEHSAEFLGIMLGQVPVWPARIAKLATQVGGRLPETLRAAGNFVGRGWQKVPGVIRKPARFASEAAIPVIEPKAINYAGGTAIGTLMGVGMVDPANRQAAEEADRARFEAFQDQGIPFTDWSDEDRTRAIELDAIDSEARRDEADQARRKQAQLDRERISPTAEMMMSTRR